MDNIRLVIGNAMVYWGSVMFYVSFVIMIVGLVIQKIELDREKTLRVYKSKRI